MKAEEILQKAKIQILTRSVFYASIMLGLKHEITDRVPTAAVDGFTIFYNKDFIEGLTLEEMVGLITHEILHVALQHHQRCGKRDKKAWNYAGDYAINRDLLDEDYVLPVNCLYDEKYDGFSTEKIYSTFDVEEVDVDACMSNDMLDAPSDKDQQAVNQNIKELVTKALVQKESFAPNENIPGGITRTLKELLYPKLDWRTILTRYMQEYVKDDYTWARTNRRYQPDFIIPSQYSPSIGNLTVAIDTSGSVSQEEIQRYLSEIESIRQTFSLESLTILACDFKLRNVHEVKKNECLLDLKIEGGMYTRCEPVLKYCDEHRPTVLIYFSDLCMKIPKEEPDYSVIWINTHDAASAPMGRTVNIN